MASLGFGGSLPFGPNIAAAFSDENQDFGDRIMSFINPGPTLRAARQHQLDQGTADIYNAAKPFIEDALQLYHANRPEDAVKSAWHAQQIFNQAGLDGVDVLGDTAKIGAAGDVQRLREASLHDPTGGYAAALGAVKDPTQIGPIYESEQKYRQSAEAFPVQQRKLTTEADAAAAKYEQDKKLYPIEYQTKQTALDRANQDLNDLRRTSPIEYQKKVNDLEDARLLLEQHKKTYPLEQQKLQTEVDLGEETFPTKVDKARQDLRQQQLDNEMKQRELSSVEEKGYKIPTGPGAGGKTVYSTPPPHDVKGYNDTVYKAIQGLKPKFDPKTGITSIPTQADVDNAKTLLANQRASLQARYPDAELADFDATYVPKRQSGVNAQGKPIMEDEHWIPRVTMLKGSSGQAPQQPGRQPQTLQPGQDEWGEGAATSGAASSTASAGRDQYGEPLPENVPAGSRRLSREEMLYTIKNAPDAVIEAEPFDWKTLNPDEQKYLKQYAGETAATLQNMQQQRKSAAEIRKYTVARTRQWLYDYYDKNMRSPQEQR